MSRIHEALKKAQMERAMAQRDAESIAGESGLPTSEGVKSQTATVAAVEAPPSKEPTVVAGLPGGRLKLEVLQSQCSQPVWKPDPNTNVFLSSVMDWHVTEQFRTLRSRLSQMRSSQPLQTLLITSSLAREGKTFVATNLAHAIVCQSNRTALVIDGDLRHSRLHVSLGAPPAPGLSDYLKGHANEAEIMQRGHNGNLFLIPGGNAVSNPSELLANGRFKTLLERVSSAFDWVLIDSPPCLPVADANVLADFCDGVLLVVRAGSTPSAVVQRAGRELSSRNVVGVVLNAMDKPLSYGPYYSSSPYGDIPGRDAKQQEAV